MALEKLLHFCVMLLPYQKVFSVCNVQARLRRLLDFYFSAPCQLEFLKLRFALLIAGIVSDQKPDSTPNNDAPALNITRNIRPIVRITSSHFPRASTSLDFPTSTSTILLFNDRGALSARKKETRRKQSQRRIGSTKNGSQIWEFNVEAAAATPCTRP